MPSPGPKPPDRRFESSAIADVPAFGHAADALPLSVGSWVIHPAVVNIAPFALVGVPRSAPGCGQRGRAAQPPRPSGRPSSGHAPPGLSQISVVHGSLGIAVEFVASGSEGPHDPECDGRDAEGVTARKCAQCTRSANGPGTHSPVPVADALSAS